MFPLSRSVFFLSFLSITLFAGFGPDTLVKVPDGYKPISQLVVGDTVISCNENGNVTEETVLLATKYCSDKICQCTSSSNEFYVGPNQLIFNPRTNALVLPDQLTVNDHCLCQPVDDQERELHEIIVSGNHLFYVTTDDVCVHNMIQVPLEVIQMVGNSMTFRLSDVYTALLNAGFLLTIEFFNNIPQKLYIIEDTDKEKNLLLSKNDPKRDVQFYSVGALNRERYCSMNEFFKNTKMGRNIKNRVNKSGIFIQGVEAYRVLEKISEYGLDKGDYIYVDRAHCDHLEVFKSNKDFKMVLNFDGTRNASKTERGQGRTLCK
jgi:hypothetical protein